VNHPAAWPELCKLMRATSARPPNPPATSNCERNNSIIINWRPLTSLRGRLANRISLLLAGWLAG